MTTKYEAYFKRGGSGNAVFVLLALSAALLFALLTLVSVLAPQVRAQAADQRAVGPVSPDNGFPLWYQDAKGLRLDLCLEQNGLCLTEEPNPGEPISFPDNFGPEMFWWAAESETATPQGGSALLVLASEAAFTQEEPRDGDQASFARIRVRIDDLQAGADYRVIHPYGSKVYENVAGGRRGINDTMDHGCFDTPCSGAALERPLQPIPGQGYSIFDGLLTWDDTGQAPPDGYIGDPNVPHTVTGSPVVDPTHPSGFQNYWRVERGSVNASGQFVPDGFIHAQSDQFSVMGKISELTAVATPSGGEFDAPQQVTLTPSANADIFYTLDGTDPELDGNDEPTGTTERYQGPIDIAQTTTLKYIVVEGEERSDIFEQRYVIVLPTELGLNADPATLDFGQSTTISGTLTDPEGQPLANQQVNLIQRALSENSFSPVEGGQLTTDAQGNFSLEGVQPEKNTIYRATFGGAEEELGTSASAPIRVNVSADILLNIGRDEIVAGQRVAMGGVVRPNKEGSEVEIRIRQAGELIARESVTLDENSIYRFVYRAERPGNYVVRAVVRGDQDNLGRISNVEKIRATR